MAQLIQFDGKFGPWYIVLDAHRPEVCRDFISLTGAVAYLRRVNGTA